MISLSGSIQIETNYYFYKKQLYQLKKTVSYIAILFLMIVNQVYAQQNLIVNGDFEESSSCPMSIGDFTCENWFSPTLTSPDYYSTCGSSICGVPSNGYGFQNAQSGNSYVGLNVNADDGYREYIAIKLSEHLVPMKHYLLKFYVSSSDVTKYGSNNLGAYFVEDTSKIYKQTMVSGTPAIIGSSNMVFNSMLLFDTIEWIELSFEYISSGCEEFLIIGNFRTQEETIFGQNLGIGIDSYYYIDNVSLFEQPSDDDIANIFSPNNDGINDYFEVETKCRSVEIMNRWGNIIYRNDGIVKWDGGSHTDGVYYYMIEFGCESHSNIKTGFIQLIR